MATRRQPRKRLRKSRRRQRGGWPWSKSNSNVTYEAYNEIEGHDELVLSYNTLKKHINDCKKKGVLNTNSDCKLRNKILLMLKNKITALCNQDKHNTNMPEMQKMDCLGIGNVIIE